MKFNGFDEALKILQNLMPEEQKKIISGIKKTQPDLAIELEKSLITVEDLKYLTEKMLSEFLRDIDLAELGLVLRIASEEVKNHLFSMLSKNLKQEVEESLKGAPVPMKKVQECHDRIMKIVRHKVENGALVLDPKSSDKLV
ncbi:MAG: hypothetical protein H6621_11080 [Halobacteriovoraceae bacterium]|nr:hypothetical protein [Halobacteriovoraceae bacterium]MCB9095601.1 hypothetical protein [Halobacteriovoraceae bacterium]